MFFWRDQITKYMGQPALFENFLRLSQGDRFDFLTAGRDVGSATLPD
jgi:hypothetical protein